jgi:hypothetical protein
VSSKKKIDKAVTPPDALLDEAAKDFDHLEEGAAAREARKLGYIAAAVRAFTDHMGTLPGYTDHHASIRWDDNGESVSIVEQQCDGVLVAVANPSGAWATLLDVSCLPLVVEAAQKCMREESDRREIEQAGDPEKPF